MDKISKFDLVKMIFPNEDDWLMINKKLDYYHNTSSIVKVKDKKYNLIGHKEHCVHCIRCGHNYAIVNHKKMRLECRDCKIN